MKRKTKAVSGWVNFPVDSELWRDTEEGGISVKLVVTDNQESNHQHGLCFGSSVTDILATKLVGEVRTLEINISVKEAEEYHFPFLDRDNVGVEQIMSRDYMAVIVIGSTGWSGFSDETGRYWNCSFSDLTDDGKAFYGQLQRLYPNCQVHFLTFLDT